jgi:hypothetical protein
VPKTGAFNSVIISWLSKSNSTFCQSHYITQSRSVKHCPAVSRNAINSSDRLLYALKPPDVHFWGILHAVWEIYRQKTRLTLGLSPKKKPFRRRNERDSTNRVVRAAVKILSEQYFSVETACFPAGVHEGFSGQVHRSRRI